MHAGSGQLGDLSKNALIPTCLKGGHEPEFNLEPMSAQHVPLRQPSASSFRYAGSELSEKSSASSAFLTSLPRKCVTFQADCF